jgi:hypothetical protein
MKKLTLSFSVIMTIMLAFVWSSCKDDETTPDGPTIVPPTAVTNLVAGASADVSFTVATPGGYKSSAVTATGGTATVKTEPAADALTGTVVVTFAAGTTAGAGTIAIVTTDGHSKSATSAAVLNITAIGAPVVNAPSATTDVVASQPVDITFTLASIAGGYKKSELTATGGTAVIKSEPAANSTAAGSIVVTFTAGTTVGAGTVKVTVTDNIGATSSATAITNITAAAIYTEISTTITESTTWTADKKYLLKGNIYVQAPAELTIQAGTKVFGDKVTKGALIVSRGAKIHATGTADNPIIFTSSAPKSFRNYGDWGGVVLLGKAQNNQSTSQAIEGISAPTGDNGLYGGDGSTDDDSSGELQYARIEFAGIALSTDNELNGLTFGGVGSGTKVDHIQVSYSGDDSYEWFGGKVNTSYLIAYKGWDDEFDTDFGYSGYNQFLVSFRDPNIADKSGSNGFESDNNAQGDVKTPQTAATFANVTFFGPYMYAGFKARSSVDATLILDATKISANYKRGAHIRRNSALKVYNTVFAGANVDGILFDAASGSAAFKGNYVARISGKSLPTQITNPVGTNYDASGFTTDNIIDANTIAEGASTGATSVDISTVFAGSTNNLWTLTAPSALLASGSPLLENAKAYDLSTVTFPDGFGFNKTVKYIGAFDAANNWATGTWINYDPNNTDYGN